MNRISVGIIGDGISAYRHAHAVSTSERFLLSSIAPRDVKKGKELMRIHNIPHLDRDPEYLLERDDIDLVVLAIPTAEHMRYIKYAERYDKAVIIESPVTLSSDEEEEVMNDVKNEGSFFFNGNPYIHMDELCTAGSSFHTFSLSFSSIYLSEAEMLHISLETLSRAFGCIDTLEYESGRYTVSLESGKGRVELLNRPDSFGLSLTADGVEILKSVPYYSCLTSLYSYVFDRLEDGRTTLDTFFPISKALENVKILS